MKIKLSLLGIALLLFTSCIKDYYGGGGDKEPKFTEKNYIYEGDLYGIALSSQIEMLEVEIQELKDIIKNGQGDETTEKELQQATQNQLELSEELNSILSLEKVGIRLPPVPPPCPRPRNCDFSELEYFVVANFVKEINILFSNGQGEVIGGGTLDSFQTLPGSNNLLKYTNLNINGSGKDITSIQVKVTQLDDILTGYGVE